MYEYITILALLWIICNQEWFGPAVEVVKQSLSEDFKRDPIGVIGATVIMLATLVLMCAFFWYGVKMMFAS
jgi:hypothetical protein